MSTPPWSCSCTRTASDRDRQQPPRRLRLRPAGGSVRLGGMATLREPARTRGSFARRRGRARPAALLLPRALRGQLQAEWEAFARSCEGRAVARERRRRARGARRRSGRRPLPPRRAHRAGGRARLKDARAGHRRRRLRRLECRHGRARPRARGDRLPARRRRARPTRLTYVAVDLLDREAARPVRAARPTHSSTRRSSTTSRLYEERNRAWEAYVEVTETLADAANAGARHF